MQKKDYQHFSDYEYRQRAIFSQSLLLIWIRYTTVDSALVICELKVADNNHPESGF